MLFENGDKILEVIKNAEERNSDTIKFLAEKFAQNIEDDMIIHTFGTGHSHMLGIEMFARAGGLGNVDAMLDPDTLTSFGAQRSGAMEKTSGVSDVIYDSYNIEAGDIMVITSNSGRNAMPIEMAMRCQKEGVYVVAFSYPVVPKGKARIRTQVCASHTKEDIDFIVKCFIEVREEMNLA